MNLQIPTNQDHEVLGSEYCSGYTDVLGKWNTGFYCPGSDESQDVFCCGTEYHKYCCTKKDQVIQSEVQDLTILVGVVVGATAAILILTLVSCFCCSCCLLYKKRNHSFATMYRLRNSSDHSGVSNMYSLSNAASGDVIRSGGVNESRTTTPMFGRRGQQQPYQGSFGGGLSEDDLRYHASGNVNGNGNNGMAHSYTLPHNLSHGIVSKHHQYIQQQQEHPQYPDQYNNPYNRYMNNPDIIAHTTHTSAAASNRHHHTLHHQHQRPGAPMPVAAPTVGVPREYGTLGRKPQQQYNGQFQEQQPDLMELQHQQAMLRQHNNMSLSSRENLLIPVTTGSAGITREPESPATDLTSMSRSFSATNNQGRNVEQHQQGLQEEEEAEGEEQEELFDSTKF